MRSNALILLLLTIRKRRFSAILSNVGLAGCFSPMSLDNAVMGYDETAAGLISKQLLLNIARACLHQPIHFTGITNIYAVRPERDYQWNREAFRLLYELLQMTMIELPQSGAPSITISK